jgi:hypothetical protein
VLENEEFINETMHTFNNALFAGSADLMRDIIRDTSPMKCWVARPE